MDFIYFLLHQFHCHRSLNPCYHIKYNFQFFYTSIPPSTEACFAYDRNALINIRKGNMECGSSAADCERLSTNGLCRVASKNE